MKKIVLSFLVIVVGMSGCKPDEVILTPVEQLQKDIEIIRTYLAENSIDAQEHESGVFYVIHRQGTGIFPEANSSVTVNYKGNILGQTELFDSNDNTSFSLLGVIVGWKIGIPLISEGGNITLYIPSGYAYGTRGSPTGGIPANANLVFNVDLLDVI
ncbi:MAG: FKBP-type peptidyl-prolyl cis-trans isomerase [Cyclobacteriaceae bacterium]|nr:FKBP-type peptidyl-prolyl cis-trans isomerase [Cyclobacteriaceae bacterium]